MEIKIEIKKSTIDHFATKANTTVEAHISALLELIAEGELRVMSVED